MSHQPPQQVRDISFDFIEHLNKFIFNIMIDNGEVMQMVLSEGDLLSMIKAMVECIRLTKDSDSLKDLR